MQPSVSQDKLARRDFSSLCLMILCLLLSAANISDSDRSLIGYRSHTRLLALMSLCVYLHRLHFLPSLHAHETDTAAATAAAAACPFSPPINLRIALPGRTAAPRARHTHAPCAAGGSPAQTPRCAGSDVVEGQPQFPAAIFTTATACCTKRRELRWLERVRGCWVRAAARKRKRLRKRRRRRRVKRRRRQRRRLLAS